MINWIEGAQHFAKFSKNKQGIVYKQNLKKNQVSFKSKQIVFLVSKTKIFKVVRKVDVSLTSIKKALGRCCKNEGG